LFSDAASKLNLKAFKEFLTELVIASRSQLFPRGGASWSAGPSQQTGKHGTGRQTADGKLKECLGRNASQQQPKIPLLIHSLSDVLLKAVRSARPLIHIMKAWSITGPHLMEVQ
jgi:brefeldin A-inhibited guanine nucleotide-exchange protein 3